jgi:hypothetical protein
MQPKEMLAVKISASVLGLEKEIRVAKQIMQLIKDNFVYVATSDNPYFMEWTELLKKAENGT